MGIASGLVLYAVIWFMVFFVVLPLRVTTQGDRGEVVPVRPQSVQPHHRGRVGLRRLDDHRVHGRLLPAP